jgi:hypothetical protein
LPAVQAGRGVVVTPDGVSKLDLYGDGLVQLVVEAPALVGPDGIMDRAINASGIAKAQTVEPHGDGGFTLVDRGTREVEAKLRRLFASLDAAPDEDETGILADLLSRDSDDPRLVDLEHRLNLADRGALSAEERQRLVDDLAALGQQRSAVKEIYDALLGRYADGAPAAELAGGLKAIDRSLLSEPEIAALESAVVDRSIQEAYQDVLGREPTEEEVQAWRGALLGTGDRDDLAALVRAKIRG